MFIQVGSTIIRRLQRKTSGGAYIPELDGLRFIAIAMVLIQHLSERVLKYTQHPNQEFFLDSWTAYWSGRGTSGVLLFFAISGFILGLPFLKKNENNNITTGLASYYQRRLTRLEPPYILWMSLFALLLLMQGEHSFFQLAKHWLVSIFYVHGFVFNSYSIINPVAWSLEVEIQFYVLAPLLAYLIFKIAAARRTIALIIILTSLLIIQQRLGLDTMPWKASILNHLQYFLLGFGLASYFNKRRFQLDDHWTLMAKLWDLVGLGALLGLYLFWSEEIWKEMMLLLCISGLFFAAFKGWYFRKFLASPWICTIGGMCYTIYLIHLPLFEGLCRFTTQVLLFENYGWYLLGQMFLCLPPLLLISILAFLAFEKPFMDKKWPQKWAANIRSNLSFRPFKFMTMSKITKDKVVLILLFACLPILTYTQNTGQEIDISSFQLQPLPALIGAAQAQAPRLQLQDRKIENRLQQMRLIRRDWMNNFQFAGNYLLNNGLYLDAVETFSNNAYSLTNRKNMVYNVGVVFKMPIGGIMNRSLHLKVEHNEMEVEMLRKEDLKMDIKNMVIELYEQIRLQQEMLRIRSEALETNKMALQLAETYFKEGAEPLESYSRAISQKTRSEEELAQTKSRLILSIQLLEELCGVNVIVE